ncbi:MAG: SIS domain-containing protein [Christensenellales bacterium]|jgi:6-phospho-3-hexuloisomerase
MEKFDNTEIRKRIMDELEENVMAVSEEDIDLLIDCIEKAGKIFVWAGGREFIMLQAFCMRLFHMGYKAFVVGDSNVPPVGRGDLLIVCGSGGRMRGTTPVQVERAQSAGAKALILTANPQNELSQKCDVRIALYGQSLYVLPEEIQSIQTMGSPFEQAQLVVLDYVINKMMRKNLWVEADLVARHTNLQ